MKTTILLITCLMVESTLLVAQNPLSRLGISTPFLNSGKELKQAETIRNAGQSYFQNAQGERRNVGS